MNTFNSLTDFSDTREINIRERTKQEQAFKKGLSPFLKYFSEGKKDPMIYSFC